MLPAPPPAAPPPTSCDACSRRYTGDIMLPAPAPASGVPLSRHSVEAPRRYGQADMNRRVIGCHATQDARVTSASDDVAGNEFGRYCSPCQKLSLSSKSEGSTSMSMTWRAISGRPHPPPRHCHLGVWGERRPRPVFSPAAPPLNI